MSAKISDCKKCCYTMNTWNLQIFNFIDFSLGVIFIAFAIYLYTKIGSDFMNVNIAWLGWCSALMGVMLLLVSLFSFCAITSSDCRWAMAPSRVFSLIVALLGIAMGCSAFALKNKFFDYMDESGNDIGLTDKDINLVKSWYLMVAYGTFGLVIIEIIRFKLSQGFREQALQMDGEFDALLEEDRKNWDNKISRNKEDREEKYNDLRSYYKNKYKTNETKDGKK